MIENYLGYLCHIVQNDKSKNFDDNTGFYISFLNNENGKNPYENNYLTIKENDISIEYNSDCHVVLEPSTVMSDKTWLILLPSYHNTNDKLYYALEQANIFLQWGFKVLLSYGASRNVLKKYEYELNLCYQTTYDIDLKKVFDGINIRVFTGISLITDLVQQGDFDFRLIDDMSFIQSHNITVKNHEWVDLSEIENKSKNEISYPVQSWGELQDLICETSEKSCLSQGMIATKLIGLFGCVFKDVVVNNVPLLSFTLISADPNRGKDRLTTFLYRPISDFQQKEKKDYKEYSSFFISHINSLGDDGNALKLEPMPNNYYLSSVGSYKGVLRKMGGGKVKEKEIAPHSLTIQNTEAEGFFVGLGAGDELQSSISSLCSFWTGQPPSYLTKDICIEFDENIRLSLDLMTQPRPFENLISNSIFWDRGLLNRFFLYQEKAPDYNNLEPQIFDYESINYKSYTAKIKKFLMLSSRIQVILPKDVEIRLTEIKTKYLSRKGDKYHDYLNYQNNTVHGFAGRAYEHILRIACYLAIYESEKKDLFKNFDCISRFDKKFWDVKKINGLKSFSLDLEGNVSPAPVNKIVNITDDYISRAEIIFEYYVKNLITIVLSSANDERYTKILNALYEFGKKGLPLTTSILQQKKVVRQTSNPNLSVCASELNEILASLADLGYIKIVQDSKKKLIRLHPQYKPN